MPYRTPGDDTIVHTTRAIMGMTNKEMADIMAIHPVNVSAVASGRRDLSKRSARLLAHSIDDFVRKYEDAKRLPDWFELQLDSIELIAKHLRSRT